MGWSYSKFPPKTFVEETFWDASQTVKIFPLERLPLNITCYGVARVVSLATLPVGEIGFSLLFGCRGNPPGMWVATRNPCKPDTLERPDSETVIRHIPLSQ